MDDRLHGDTGKFINITGEVKMSQENKEIVEKVNASSWKATAKGFCLSVPMISNGQ